MADRTAEDFGHEPTTLIRTAHPTITVCARCHLWIRSPRGITMRPVLWPCTSAIVLGLVSRAEAAW